MPSLFFNYEERIKQMMSKVSSALSMIGVVVLVVGIVVAFVWFHMNYKCVSEHVEYRESCTTTHGKNSSHTTCRQYPVDVCDDWEPR